MLIALMAAVACSPCHEAKVRSFAQTPMAHSISRPAREKRPTQTGKFKEQRWQVDGARHHVDGESVTVAWAVGSGHEGKSYLYGRGGALFQSPLAWYTRRGAWDLSPGYAEGTGIDFLRPVTADCLFCHAGSSTPVAGRLNTYAREPIPEPGITCQRCHGDASEHQRKPGRGNIVNPSRLSNAARDSVCEQCHLAGAARVLLPGKQWNDFRAGLELEQVFSVYVPAAPQPFKVVSHAEQLALSRCLLESRGKLWCASCHDVHQPKAQRAAPNASCVACHRDTRPHGDDCTGCHMPRTPAHDGGHTAFTDHRIQIPGRPAAWTAKAGLRAWRQPAPGFQQRGLGLAYAGTGETKAALELLLRSGRDPEVQSALGLLYLRAGQAKQAVAAFAGAAKAEPDHSQRALNLAAALAALGRRNAAIAEAQRAVALEPLLVDAYALLAELEPERAAYWRAQFQAAGKR
jgi:hypothetical protein